MSRISPMVDNDNNSIRNKVITAQQNSPIIKNCVSFLSGTDELRFTDDISQSIAKCKKLQIPTFSLNKDLLMHENRLVIPIDAEDHVIKAYHSCGHFSANQTKKMILEKYWCPKLHGKTRQIIDSWLCGCVLRDEDCFGVVVVVKVGGSVLAVGWLS